MRSVKMQNGIGISTRTGTVFIDASTETPVGRNGEPVKQPDVALPSKTEVGQASWANWGLNGQNNLPQQMVADIETCGILNSIIDHQSRFALGKGVMWAWVRIDKTGEQIVEEICTVPEITDFMEANNHYYHELGFMKDQIGMANGLGRFVLDVAGKKIVLLQRDDITEMRLQQMDDKGRINNVYLSAQWDRVPAGSAEDNSLIKTIPLLNPSHPLKDLTERAAASQSARQFAYLFKYPSWHKKYYSMPLWYANLKWVKIAQGVPAMKAALYNNSMRPKYQVVVYREMWDELFLGDGPDKKAAFADYTEEEIREKKNAFYDQIDEFLVGAENAGKAVFVDGWTSEQQGKQFKYVDIIPIEDTTKDGGYLPDSAAANSEIAFSMRYNPAIIGASMPSGPYTNSQGGSNVREAVSMQIITHEPERQNILSLYRLIRNFNGWNTAHAKPGLMLEPIIPNTMLTTLDTGAGTAPTVKAAPDPKKTKSDGIN